jgi:hypothetical protein
VFLEGPKESYNFLGQRVCEPEFEGGITKLEVGIFNWIASLIDICIFVQIIKKNYPVTGLNRPLGIR